MKFKELLKGLVGANIITLEDMEQQIEETREYIKMNKQIKEVYEELRELKGA